MGIRLERDAGLFLIYPCKTFYHMTCIYQRPTTNLYVSKSCYHHICNSLFTDRFAQWLEAQSLQGTAPFLYAKG